MTNWTRPRRKKRKRWTHPRGRFYLTCSCMDCRVLRHDIWLKRHLQRTTCRDDVKPEDI